MTRLLFLIGLSLLSLKAAAQDWDTISATDTGAFVSPVIESTFEALEQLGADGSDIQQQLPSRSRGWLFALLALCTAIYAFSRMSFGKEWQSSIRAFSNRNIAQQLYRDREITQNLPSVLFTLNFVLITSLYIYLLVTHFDPDLTVSLPLLAFAILVIFTMLMAARFGALKAFGWLFPIGERVDYYCYTLMLANKIMALVLLPLLFLIAFADDALSDFFVWCSIGFVALFVLYKIVMGILIVRDYLYYYRLHFILYICTFEIAPLLIILRVLASGYRRFLV